MPVGIQDKAKRVLTKDLEGKENGYLLELKKSGRKTEAYLTVAKPNCFKGYHLHKVRESNYTCVKGTVRVILWSKDGREDHVMTEGDKLHIPINVPTGLQNTWDEDGWLINHPDPAYDPLLTDEQVDYNEEEVQQWWMDQK